jgi:hypothetical protein
VKRSAVDALLSRVIDEADAGQLPVLIDDWLTAGDARHWIARALRIDLAVLVARPELVVPCLLRRSTWLGDEFPLFVHRAPPPPDAAAVRGLARSWEVSWHRPYLRTLRTPQVPLDGGVIEEYRSGAAGPLWLTASHVGLGADIAWDRASGRRVVMAMPAARAPTWKLVRERRELVSSAHVWPLPIESAHEPLQLIELDDELAVVTASYDEGYGEDHEYFTYFVDLRSGVRRAMVPFGCTYAARRGETIYTTDHRDLLYAWSADGVELRRGSIAGAGLVMAADGTFATRTLQVVRVFDPERVLHARVDGNYTLGLVALSPDGTRAITGRVVCDAHTGEQLAAISFNGLGGWLEGGPPRDCRALCDDVVAEILPFGYHLWDSTTGEILVDDRDHRADHRDAVAFAPNGRTHAILKRGTLRIYDNHTLRVVHEEAIAITDTWRLKLAFSHDGSTLWIGEPDAELGPVHIHAGREMLPVLRAAAITDGIVTLDELALPIDDADAEVSADGLVILGSSAHYVRS